MEKLTTIVDVERYMELLNCERAIKTGFVAICYYRDKDIFIYSKNEFGKIHKESVDKLNEIISKQNKEIEKLDLYSYKLELEQKKYMKKFGWQSFARGAIFGIGITALILSIISLIIK
jgi:hypothetical protein